MDIDKDTFKTLLTILVPSISAIDSLNLYRAFNKSCLTITPYIQAFENDFIDFSKNAQYVIKSYDIFALLNIECNKEELNEANLVKQLQLRKSVNLIYSDFLRNPEGKLLNNLLKLKNRITDEPIKEWLDAEVDFLFEHIKNEGYLKEFIEGIINSYSILEEVFSSQTLIERYKGIWLGARAIDENLILLNSLVSEIQSINELKYISNIDFLIENDLIISTNILENIPDIINKFKEAKENELISSQIDYFKRLNIFEIEAINLVNKIFRQKSGEAIFLGRVVKYKYLGAKTLNSSGILNSLDNLKLCLNDIALTTLENKDYLNILEKILSGTVIKGKGPYNLDFIINFGEALEVLIKAYRLDFQRLIDDLKGSEMNLKDKIEDYFLLRNNLLNQSRSEERFNVLKERNDKQLIDIVFRRLRILEKPVDHEKHISKLYEAISVENQFVELNLEDVIVIEEMEIESTVNLLVRLLDSLSIKFSTLIKATSLSDLSNSESLSYAVNQAEINKMGNVLELCKRLGIKTSYQSTGDVRLQLNLNIIESYLFGMPLN